MVSESAKKLFEQAVLLEPQDVEDFLQRTVDDDGVRREVHDLLRQRADADHYFEGLAGRLATLIPDREPPRQVGNYALGELLGRGGMGAVYRAERVDGQYEKEVAVKLLPELAANEQSRQRFLLERQILARLDHPHICRLLDGGFTEEGLPYFVMELVAGTSLDVYCDDHQLDLDQRLALILQVCEAVEFAHQNLVIHRDIKPSNILVENNGQAQLLDFGIGKLLTEEHERRTTRVPMTPLYAAPELLAGEEITTAADVYSLGVLAYQLLVGLHPKLEQGDPDLKQLRILTDTNPITASVRFQKHYTARPDEAGVLARERATAPDALPRQLRGDLDNILSKALATETGRRYASVADLALDLRRYRAHQPVEARAPTWRYRAGKFVRRNRLAVTLTGVALAALCGLGLTLYQSTAAQLAQAEVIAAERDRAEAVSRFLLEMLRQANPDESGGVEATVQTLINQAADQLIDGLADQPETRVELLKTAAEVQGYVGAYERALALLAQEYDMRAELHGSHSAEVAAVLERQSAMEDSLGRLDEAERLARQALELRQQLGDPQGMAASHKRLGRALHRQGNYDRAQTHFDQALTLYENVFGVDHEETLSVRSHLAWLALHQGNPEASAEKHQQLLDAGVRRHGNVHSSMIENHLGLGQALSELGDLDGARQSLLNALDINHQLYGEDHHRNGFVLNSLGRLEDRLGNLDAAAERYRQAVALFADRRNPDRGLTLANLGRVEMKRERADLAEPLFREALAIMRENNPDHWALGDVQSRLGVSLQRLERFDDAESELVGGYEHLRAKRGADDRWTRQAAERIVAFYEGVDKPGLADPFR